MNDYQKSRFTRRMLDAMFNTVSHKTNCHLAMLFQEGHTMILASPPRYMCRDLLEEQAHLAIYDPKVPAEEILRH